MSKIALNLSQGSPEWHAHRAKHFNASDAAAMLGMSQYETRDELIHRLATGERKPIDSATERRFADGHRFERLARALVEQALSEDLYPKTCVYGNLSASLDGITIDDSLVWEHKTLNDEMREVMAKSIADAEQGSVPNYLAPQLEHQLICCKAEKTLVTASVWDEDDQLIESRHAIYVSSPELAARIIAGWAQLEKDIAAYRVPEPVLLLVAERLDRLPALTIKTKGEVLASNLQEFKTGALEVINSIRTDLSSDQDFLDASAAIKWCAESETKIKAAGESALGGDVRKLMDTLHEVGQLVRAKRLTLEKQVTHRKDERKRELVSEAKRAAIKHIDAGRYGKLAERQFFGLSDTFNACIRGLSSIASMQNALNTKLAEIKIAADQLDAKIVANSALIDAHPEHTLLFGDRDALLIRETDYVQLAVSNRIAEHKRNVEAQALALKQREEEAARREQEAMRKSAEIEAERVRLLAMVEAKPEPKPEPEPIEHPAPVQIAAPVVDSVKPEEPKPAANLNLGQINARLVCVSVSSDQLRALGFAGEQVRNARMYSDEDFRAIRAAIIRKLSSAI